MASARQSGSWLRPTARMLAGSLWAAALVFAALPATAQTMTFDALPERVEADVSTRSVSITSSFTGGEIVVFGAVNNAQPAAADAWQQMVDAAVAEGRVAVEV